MSLMMPQKSVYGVRAIGAVLLVVLMMVPGGTLAQPTVKEIVEQSPEEKAKVTAKEGAEAESSQPTGPQEEFNRGVPRTSVAGFLAATAKRDYHRAAEYLDLRNLPRELTKTQGPQLARQLKIVFDRSLWIDLTSLSRDPKGQDNDGLASFRDHVGKIEIPGKTVEILLQRVPRGDGVSIWQFSSATVAQIPRLYRTYGYGLLDTIFPNAFFDLKVLGVEVWLWVGLMIIAILAYLAAFVLTKTILLFLQQRHPTPMRDQVCRLVRGPLRFLLLLVVAGLMIEYINPPLWFQALLKARTLFSVAVIWMAFWIIDFLIDRLSEHYQLQGRSTACVLLHPLGTAAKTVFVIIASLVWLDNLGFKVTTLLAGLGIGGLAVALALQKPIENLISAITLYASQPVAVGDFCRFGENLGTVEEIRLRATKCGPLTIPCSLFPIIILPNFRLRIFRSGKRFGTTLKSDYGMTRHRTRSGTSSWKSGNCSMPILKFWTIRQESALKGLARFLLTWKSLLTSTSLIMENSLRWRKISTCGPWTSCGKGARPLPCLHKRCIRNKDRDRTINLPERLSKRSTNGEKGNSCFSLVFLREKLLN